MRVTLMYGYVLSSRSRMLYLGRCFLMRLHSRMSASISDPQVMYSNSAMSFTMRRTLGGWFLGDWKYCRTRFFRFTAFPT